METETKSSQLGKRLHREVTAERRHKEVSALQEVKDALPLSKTQLDQAKQASILSLAINYLRLREMMDRSGTNYGALRSLSMEEQLMFRGFVLVLDSELKVLYATENMTEQLGPYLADVVGQPFANLLHEEDREALQPILDMSESFWQTKTGVQHMFVVRMKTTMASTVRSQAKVQYKNVNVTCRVKAFGSAAGSSSTAMVLLCRIEALIGFPEIVMGAYVDCKVYKHCFTGIDPKGQWLLGYHMKDLVGQNVLRLRHPCEVPPAILRRFLQPLLAGRLMRDGYLRLPKGRIITGWGEWVWHYIEVRAPFQVDNSVEGRDVSARIHLLGPDDGTPHSPAWRFSSSSFVEFRAVIDLIMTGASESDIDGLVSSLLSQMNISRSELPRPWMCDPEIDSEKIELTFEDQRKIAQQHFQRLGGVVPLLSNGITKSVSSGSTSDESSGYLSEDSSPLSSHGSAHDNEQAKENSFPLGAHEDGLLLSNSYTSSELDSLSSMDTQQYFMDVVSNSVPHHLFSRHDSVEDALRSVLESQTAPQ